MLLANYYYHHYHHHHHYHVSICNRFANLPRERAAHYESIVMIGAQHTAMNKRQVSELWLLAGPDETPQHGRHISNLPQRGIQTSYYIYCLTIGT